MRITVHRVKMAQTMPAFNPVSFHANGLSGDFGTLGCSVTSTTALAEMALAIRG